MWVLILMVVMNGNGLSMQAFNTKGACNFALNEAKELNPRVTGVCVPKGRK